MKRTISAMVGKGSVTHNSRTFTAENVDSERTHLNIDYCNEPIKKVYHEMFDEALKQYNDKQKRKDRKIPDYYKHIESGKQEKLFHEIIFQIGNKDDMSATGDHAELARTVLDEYYRGFQERNPYLRVFSAHLHMDEATPHIHIDFVPFTTGSKRGLETRVSLKQAMLNMGFKGEGRSDNELNRWILSEKKVLAQIMERYGIEWEQKGTHEQHLSVLDYKKQERAKEVAELDREIEEKQLEVKGLKATVEKIEEAKEILGDVEKQLDEDPQLQLPEPQGLITVKSYKKKFVEPLINRLKNLVRTVLARSYQGFQERNPYLRVFSAHLHMDEATPHIHIDFVPFTTGSKRGLETRVSLKQAMLNMGFKGEGKSDNELNRWILSEKKVLAQIMERYGIEWEQKGTHEQHLSVLDYKKQERAKEVAELDREIEEKQLEVKGLKATVEKIEEAKEILGDVEKQLDEDPKLQLPEPQGLMTAKSYKKKFVDPLINRLKNLVRTVLAKSYQGWENYHRINNLNGRLHRENEHLKYENSKLKELNGMLREQNKAYRLLEKVFGKHRLNDLIEQERGYKKSKQRDAR